MGDAETTDLGVLNEESPKSTICKTMNKVSILKDRITHHNHRKHINPSDIAIRISNTGSLSGMYAMLVACLALVLTMAFILSGNNPNSGCGCVLFIFHIYVYFVALVCFVLLEVSIRKFKRQQARSGESLEMCVQASLSASDRMSDGSLTPSRANSDIFLVSREKQNSNAFRNNSLTEMDVEKRDFQADFEDDTSTICYESVMEKLKRFPAFQFNGEGMNMFARLGIITFGLGAVLLDGFRLLMLAEDPSLIRCYSGFSIAPIILRMTFTFLQIFSLFKNHKVLINYKHIAVKFGLLHVAAANITTWVYTLILEAKESFDEGNKDSKHNSSHILQNHTQHHSIYEDGGVSAFKECRGEKSTLYDAASPYLYPFVIEFSLLAAALVYKLYANIGMTTYCPKKSNPEVEEDKEGEKHKEDGACAKAHTGLCTGMALFIGTTVAMCFFIYLLSKHGTNDTIGHIHLTCDISGNGLALLSLGIGFYKFSKLRFTGILEEILDQNLLIVGLAGSYILIGFLSYASAVSLNASHPVGHFAKLQLASALLSFVQITAQSVFIVDALRRRPKTPEDEVNKPGRSVVTFLLITNLALWLVNTFQLKELHHAPLFTNIYGKLAWTIIMHIFLPLTIFFRFHASVCLSDIWEKSYSNHHVHMVHLLHLINKNQ